MSTVEVETAIRLDRDSNGMLMTPDEFDAVTDYDDNYAYELIHGVLVVNAIPSEAEGDPNEELGRWLRNYGEQHPQGAALDKTLGERYIRTAHSRRKANRVIWCGLGRLPNPKEDVPAIAVEFVSRSRRDRRRDYIEKRSEYAAVGVVEYWIIDRFQRTMTVCLQDGSQKTLGEQETYETDLLPGFQLPLGKLLALADVWAVDD